MKLKEFKKIVDDCCKRDPEASVVIPIKIKGRVGATPIDSIKGAGLGFDWNTGKFMIWTENELTINKEK